MKILLWCVIYSPNFLNRVNQTWLEYLLTHVIAELPLVGSPLTGVSWMDYRYVEIWSPPHPPPSSSLREATWSLGWQRPLNQLPLAVSPMCCLNRLIFHACMHANLLQLCLILCSPTDYSSPGSFVHGILQARVLEWVAMPFSRGSSQLRDRTCVSYISCTGGRVSY